MNSTPLLFKGRAVSSQHAGGADLTTVAYNSDGSMSVTEARGNVHGYGFSTQFGLVKPTAVTGVPSPSAGGKAFTYDVNGFVASRTDWDGNVTTFVNNVRGLPKAITEAAGGPVQ
jgi:YD repeat-containing protein